MKKYISIVLVSLLTLSVLSQDRINVIVKDKPEHKSKSENFHKEKKSKVINKLKNIDWQIVEIDKNKLRDYQESEIFANVITNLEIRVKNIPNDTGVTNQWALDKIGLFNAWDITTGNNNIIVAIFDTGVDGNHPDLTDNMYRFSSGDFGIQSFYGESPVFGGLDDFGHGTHVSGIIGAKGNNSIGLAGVNWNIKMLSCKFLNQYGSGNVFGAVSLYDYVVTLKKSGVNIRVANNSWGGKTESYPPLSDIMKVAEDNGILNVCAAGNESSDIDVERSIPGGFDNRGIISVQASANDDSLAFFSNYGFVRTDVAAPGLNIFSTITTNSYLGDLSGYRYLSGTSMATPQVSGLAALILSINPALDTYQLRDIILSSKNIDKITNNNKSSTLGGRINTFKAINSNLIFTPKTNSFPIITSTEKYVRYKQGDVIKSPVVMTTDADGDTVFSLSPSRPLFYLNEILYVGDTVPSLAMDYFTKIPIGAADGNGGSVLSNAGIGAYRDTNNSPNIQIELKLENFNETTGELNLSVISDDYSKIQSVGFFNPAILYIFNTLTTNFNGILLGNQTNFSLNLQLPFKGSVWTEANTIDLKHGQSKPIIINTLHDEFSPPYFEFTVKNPNNETVPCEIEYDISKNLSLSNSPGHLYLLIDGAFKEIPLSGKFSVTNAGHYRIFAELVDTNGYIYSSRLIFNVMDGEVVIPPAPVVILNTVTNLVSTFNRPNIRLTWMDNSINETKYEIEMSYKVKNTTYPFTKIGTISSNSYFFDYIPSVKNANYSFRVRACSTNCANWSNIATIRVK